MVFILYYKGYIHITILVLYLYYRLLRLLLIDVR